jgi:hypothetical protein
MDTLISQLVYLYSLQEKGEQFHKEASVKNKQGFNKIDAPILTSITKYYIERNSISDKQRIIVEKRLLKYRKQLSTIGDFNAQDYVNQERFIITDD